MPSFKLAKDCYVASLKTKEIEIQNALRLARLAKEEEHSRKQALENMKNEVKPQEEYNPYDWNDF